MSGLLSRMILWREFGSEYSSGMSGKILNRSFDFLHLNLRRGFFSTQPVFSTSEMKSSENGKLMDVRNLPAIIWSK